MGMRTLVIVVVAIVLGGSHAARADDDAARRHFDAGVKAYNLQRFDVALKEFQSAYEAREDAAFLFNIAQAQRQLGQPESAARSYRAYLSQRPEATNREEVETRIAEMDQAVKQKQASPAPATAPPAAPKPSIATIEYRDTGKSKRLAGIITADLGIAGIAVGVVLAILSKQAGDAAYRPSSGVYDSGADDRQFAERNAEIACFVIGGAAAVIGTTIWMLGRKERHHRVTASSTGGLSVTF
jgi:tetratricopeptide (TPR) repeat protein